MKQARIVALWVILTAVLGVVAFCFWRFRGHGLKQLTGVVLIENSDPHKQTAIAGADITAYAGPLTVHGTSDQSGFFHLDFPRRIPFVDTVSLTVTHPNYRSVSAQQPARENEFVVRLTPLHAEEIKEIRNPIEIRDPRIRYSAKATRTLNVGGFEKVFDVVNRGNLPCDNEGPCSPDQKWKAARSIGTFDAGDHNEFRNIRLSCIAGPCPFTNIESVATADNGRKLTTSVLNWSDTTTFLLEAEVSQTMVVDVIQESYPAKFLQTLSFTLPRDSEGPTIEAEVQGRDIVFVLGPDLLLSWGTCSRTVTQDANQLIRCDVKPGYVVVP